MKVSLLHNVQHRELRSNFRDKYHSVWVDAPWNEVASAEQYARFYHTSIEEVLFAARAGFDAIALNEHHQNAFGGLANPNIIGAILAHATRDVPVAIFQLGSTLPTTAPPNRLAEEYAMLDLLSEGRLIAGMPVGSPMDVSLCYGVPPLEHRERYRESHDLIVKAWTSREPFAWNGKYFQLPCVNVWPRPLQKPYPPVWVPGTASPSTWDFCAEHDYGYMVLTAFSGRMGIQDSARLVRGFQERAASRGRDTNPFRSGLALLPIVGESMAQIERDYFRHVDYFFNGALHIAPQHLNPPGTLDYATLKRTADAVKADPRALNMFDFKGWTFKDFVDNGVIVAGTPKDVTDQVEELVKTYRCGHLMVCMQIGSTPRELALESMAGFAETVIPRVRPLFEDEGWTNHWWPERLRKPRTDAQAPQRSIVSDGSPNGRSETRGSRA